MKKISVILFFLVSFLLFPPYVFAGWYFNWSCWRSSGRQGPYATRSNCESELNRARNACAGGSKFSSSGCSGSDDYRPGPSPGSGSGSGSRFAPAPGSGPQKPIDTVSGQPQIYHPTQDEEKKLREAAEEENRRNEEATRKFNEDKEQALKSLKGGSGTMTMKGGTDVFGMKGNPDVELKVRGAEKPAMTSAWKQLHCSAYISGFAFQAAATKKGTNVKDPDWDEVHYLAVEANKALSGEPIGLQCPEAPEPSKPYGRLNLGPDSTVVKFYKILLRATDEQSVRANNAVKRIREATATKQVARAEVEKREKEVTKLQDEIKEPPKTEEGPKNPELAKEKDRSALDEAKRALEQSMRAKERVDKLSDEMITSAIKEKTEAQALLGQFEKLFNQVQADPNKASDFLKMIQK